MLPEAGGEAEEMVVDAGAYDGEGRVEGCEGEEKFALDVGGCDVGLVEVWGVVVED